MINVSAVATDNPLGQNISKNLNQNESYTFSLSDFNFSSPKNNSFKALKIISLPATGILKLSSDNVTVNQLITNPNELVYTAALVNASFTYKMIDSEDLESDANYTISFTVRNPNAQTISVSFKKPADWGTSGVNIWAWNANGNLFSSWPGQTMTYIGNGWHTYTFAETVTNVNVIFSKNGTPQTVDIMGISQNTCYQSGGLSNNKITVNVVDCPITSIEKVESKLKMIVYPQPAINRFVVDLPNIADHGEFVLSVIDVKGTLVKQTSFTGHSIIIERDNLASGLYIVQVVSKTTGQQFSSKLSFN